MAVSGHSWRNSRSSRIFLPVFPRAEGGVFAEYPGKMAGGGKPQIAADGGERLVRIAEEAFGLLRFFFEDARSYGDRLPCLRSALELGPVLGGEQALPLPVQLPLLLLQALPLVPQADNEPLHPLGVVQYDPVLQVHDGFRRVQQLALLDVGVAETEGVVHVHAAADGRPADQRGGDDAGVFELPQLLLCQNAASNGRGGRDPLLQRGSIPLAYYTHNGLFLVEGVVDVWRFGIGTRQFALCLPAVLLCFQPFLVGVVDGDVGQRPEVYG